LAGGAIATALRLDNALSCGKFDSGWLKTDSLRR
jgi:hypothetical protein